jgi:SulP family sulfate permease
MTWLPKSVVCLRYYNHSRFRADAFASFLLSLQTFPLAIAIPIAIGIHPFSGIFCAAVTSLVASIFGDSKIRVSTPNVIFIAVASSIVARDGILGLFISALLAGVLLIFFGSIRLGAALQALPRPVAVGFTTGVAVLVVSQQLPAFLGLGSQISADHVIQRPLTLLRNLPPHATILAFAAFALVAVCRRVSRHVPTGLIVIAMGVFLVRFAHFSVHTVEAFHGSSTMIPSHPAGVFKSDLLGRNIAPAFAIAVLVAIESLQAIALASGLTGECSDPDGELILQGGANLTSACVGGLPVSGVSSHTLENAHLGAQTPVAGILQAVFLMLFLLLTAPVVPLIPLPVISALVLSSVLSMTEWREIYGLRKERWIEGGAWAATFLLTIIVDLPIAIALGMFTGMFLYIRRLRDAGLAKTIARNSSCGGYPE